MLTSDFLLGENVEVSQSHAKVFLGVSLAKPFATSALNLIRERDFFRRGDFPSNGPPPG